MPQHPTAPAPVETEREIAKFLDRFAPASTQLIRACRAELRALLPAANELVYDNYNFFVIGYCSSLKPTSCIVSLAAAANGVGLSFYQGASLADPEQLLQGSGKQNRFVRLPDIGTLRAPGVLALIDAAVSQAKVPLAAEGIGATVVRSVSAKQRPRR